MSQLPIITYMNYIANSKKSAPPKLESVINTINYLIDISNENKSDESSILDVIEDLSNEFEKEEQYKDKNSIVQNFNNFGYIEIDDDMKIDIENLIKEDFSTLCDIKWIDEGSIRHIKKNAELDKSHEQERKNKLNNYLSRLQIKKPIINIQDYSIFEDVRKKAPNFKEAIDYFKGSFILNHFKRKNEEIYQAPIPLLLLGDPGIGKTFFAKELAKCLKTSSHLIDANSISANWVLAGSSSQWKSAEAGLIFKQMLDSPTISPIIIFDEIDKLSFGKNYDPFSTFHQLLESENAKSFKDEYLDCSFDASNIIYILTANDANGIPESLLSRMKVIHIKKPDVETTHIIAQNIYSSIIGKSGLFEEKLKLKQLKELETLTPREIKQILNNSIFSQSAEIDMSNIEQVKTNQTLIIKKDKPKKVFGIIPNKYND